jgi:hypothetical protein
MRRIVVSAGTRQSIAPLRRSPSVLEKKPAPKFEAAARRDLDNATITNNLRLLSESSKYIVRAEQ